MNPRIFKKLTKKAALLIDKLGCCKHKHKVVVGVHDAESIETHVKADLKHRDRWYKDKQYGRCHFTQLSGTVGYGCVSGYYEQEWEDSCAWSILRNHVVDSFTDWKDFKGEGFPDNNCPKKVKANPAGIFRHAKSLLDNKQIITATL